VKYLTTIARVLLLQIGLSGAAVAADLFVICHPGVKLQPAEVRDMFLGEKQFSGSLILQPADNNAAQPAFLDKVLKMGADKYSTAWTKKSFRDGLNPPPVKGTDAEALDYVRRTVGACSYTSTAPGNGVVLIETL
jgi:hypothetical protein